MDTRTKMKKVAKRIAIATDAALVKAGEAAKQRQRDRAKKAAVRTTGKIAAVAATAAALVAGARVAVRARRRRAVSPNVTA